MKRLLLFVLFLVSFHLIAQNNKIDSLKSELKKANDTTKVNLLSSIGMEYVETLPDTAMHYLNQSLLFAEKVDYIRGITRANRCIGYLHIYWGDYNNAVEQYLKAEKIYEQLGDKNSIPYNNIAVCYYYLGNYQKSLDYYLKDLRILEKAENKELMIGTLNGIGNIYHEIKQYKDALFYYKKALAMSTELNHQREIVLVLKNIGNVYHVLNNNDTALVYYNKALSVSEKYGDKSETATILMNIGNIYNFQKNHTKSLNYYEKALSIHRELKKKNEIAITLFNIGTLEYKSGNYEKGIASLKKSLVIAESIDNKDVMINANYELAEAYYKKGDYKSAYNHYKIHSAVKDSVFNESSTKAIAEMSTKYETEKKEKEIEILTKEKQNQAIIRNTFIAGCVLLLVVIALFYNRYRIKHKANIEIAYKNKEINESISYAKRIQTSFLTSEKYIAKHLSDYFIFYQPRNVVSGDFYWLMEKNNNLYVCTADCTGHGIPGAFMSLISMGVLNEIIYSKTHISHTDDILNELRRIIILAVNPEGSSEEGRDGMDAVLSRFDFQKMEMEYSAANRSFYIIRNGELLTFKPDKMPIGKHVGMEKSFTRNVIPLQKGDCIYTFSDGYADQFGGTDDKKFQTKRLKKMFLDNYQKPMNIQKEIYAQTLKDWQGTNEQVDDILVMGVRV